MLRGCFSVDVNSECSVLTNGTTDSLPILTTSTGARQTKTEHRCGAPVGLELLDDHGWVDGGWMGGWISRICQDTDGQISDQLWYVPLGRPTQKVHEATKVLAQNRANLPSN